MTAFRAMPPWQRNLLGATIILSSLWGNFWLGYFSVVSYTPRPWFPIELKNPLFPWLADIGLNPAWGEGLILLAGAAALCWASDRMKLA